MDEGGDGLTGFQWEPCPGAQRMLDQIVGALLEASPRTQRLADAMAAECGTRFFDWIDHLALPVGDPLAAELESHGFAAVDGLSDRGWRVFDHPRAVFPSVVLWDSPLRAAAIKVESAADFAAAHRVEDPTVGVPHGRMRSVQAWEEGGVRLYAVERHGWRGMDVPETPVGEAIAGEHHYERFCVRRRKFAADAAAFDAIGALIDRAIDELGQGWTAALWFAAERDYWMRRNRAARVQKARQDRLGLGWANHDHHTYRCRRETFPRVIAVFEKLGCTLRERFYAGAEAGWGAQVLEQPDAGIVVFADVDMAPDEVAGDFAHGGFSPRSELGTVGLWCALHGESMLEAGMHHLEAQFSFDLLRDQLQGEPGIGMMKPFTDFPHLRQQFTEGERWAVDPVRVKSILEAGQITVEQAEQFCREGAIGSHLENLERNDGFKGFNQSGINEIIAASDPRRQLSTAR